MTVSEMHTQVNLRSQKINSNAFDTFLPEEIDEYLNLATTRFVKSRMNPLSNPYREGFEQSQKRIDDLRSLVVKDVDIDTTQVTGNAAKAGYFVDRGVLPDNYNYLISLRFKVNYSRSGVTFTLTSGKRIVDGVEGTDYKTKVVEGKIVQSDDIYELLSDPFNKPKVNEPLADMNSGGIDVYTDDKFIVDTIIINYIREPATISLSTPTHSDLPDHTHDEIVDMAVELMLSDIGQLGAGQQIESLKKVE